MALAQTPTRVIRNTSNAANERIRGETERSLEWFEGADTATITRRLQELRREWDVERVIETEAPLMIASGIALSALVDRRFAALSALAAGMLLTHNVQGWYPLLPVFRRAGLRTTREIAEEVYALKRARGDFSDLSSPGSDEERAIRAYQAAAWR